MTLDVLEKELKEGKLNSLYLFYGEERFLLESNLKKIKKIFGETIPGINFVTIDETNIQNLISDLQTPPFGYNKKLVIIKNSGILKKEEKRKNVAIAELKEKITNFLKENINEIKGSNLIIFIEGEVEKTTLYKLIEKEGNICEFENVYKL